MAPGVFICPSNKLRTYFITLPGSFIVKRSHFFWSFVMRCDVMKCNVRRLRVWVCRCLLDGVWKRAHECLLWMQVECWVCWRRAELGAASICRSWCRLRNRCRAVRKVNAAFRGRVESCRPDRSTLHFYSTTLTIVCFDSFIPFLDPSLTGPFINPLVLRHTNTMTRDPEMIDDGCDPKHVTNFIAKRLQNSPKPIKLLHNKIFNSEPFLKYY